MIIVSINGDKTAFNSHERAIYWLLADASQGTVDPARAEGIAFRAIREACDNREGK